MTIQQNIQRTCRYYEEWLKSQLDKINTHYRMYLFDNKT